MFITISLVLVVVVVADQRVVDLVVGRPDLDVVLPEMAVLEILVALHFVFEALAGPLAFVRLALTGLGRALAVVQN